MTLVCGCLTRFDNGRVTQLRHEDIDKQLRFIPAT
jgi:hypothetical protein